MYFRQGVSCGRLGFDWYKECLRVVAWLFIGIMT